MHGTILMERLDRWAAELGTWLAQDVLTAATLVQAVIVALALVAALYLARPLAVRIARGAGAERSAARARTERVATDLLVPALWLVILLVALGLAPAAHLPNGLIEVAASLTGAWVAIRLASNLIRDPFWSKSFALVAWLIAALNILGLLEAAERILDSASLTVGGLRISALTVSKGLLTLIALLWLANFTIGLIERRIDRLPNVTPSVRTLATNFLKILFIALAIVVALAAVGIDLTAFAVFSGAVGVGVGFGLQKVVSNLVSGVILLIDRSVKPGDVIAIGDTYGWINSLSARYVSVITRDGTEYLIPNEDLITNRVENWSYSNDLLRLRVPIGISYKSDVRKAIELCLAAVADTPRALDEPKPVCLLAGFGDSSVDLSLRFWISDPTNGLSNVKSEVLLRVWDAFHAHGIEIPFPQRDLHIRSPEALRVVDR